MKTQIVKFYTDEIVCYNGKVLVAPIAKSIGLNPDSAVRGIKKHKILGPWATVEYVKVDENQGINYLGIPIEYVMGWLFSIDSEKVNEEIRPKLELYQKECFQVLNDHFIGKHKVVSDSHIRLAEIYSRIREIDKNVKGGLAEKKELLSEKSDIEFNNFRQLGIDFDMANDSTSQLIDLQ